jgi:L-ascorbate metabolism protein UlaG (beta-lactamase superfamily)
LEKFHRPIYVCGLNLGKWFTGTAKIESSRVKEMDWWQNLCLLDTVVDIQFVPVQHWSKRHAYGDERKSLWGGFSVSVKGFKFFFNGDTGFTSELYEEIGQRCGPFDLCAIPIGAYEPRSVMTMQHVDPEQAFMIHRLLKSTVSFGIHYATFILTDEPIDEPKARIEKLSKENPDVPPFLAIEHGASISFDAGKCYSVGWC